MLALEFAQISDVGRVRPGNEDYVGFVSPETAGQGGTPSWLFALADGVGGHEQGEVASRTAVESLLEGFRAARKEEALTGLLRRLVQTANARVFETAVKSGVSGAGMATTLVACALRYDRAVVAHVGDSRCYLIRQNEVLALTRDHTVATEHVKLGLLSEDDVAEAETRHVLTRSLGGGLIVDVEINDHQVLPGDVLLLCSDGLHGAVRSSDIAQVVGPEADLQAAAAQLVALANDRDGGDNVSAQLIRVKSVERVGMYGGRPYKLR
jgi:protein phosphatase